MCISSNCKMSDPGQLEVFLHNQIYEEIWNNTCTNNCITVTSQTFCQLLIGYAVSCLQGSSFFYISCFSSRMLVIIGTKFPPPRTQSEIGFLMVKGSVGSSVNFLTPRTAAAHRPSSRDKRMFSVFCFSIHGTHGPESNFAYYRMMAVPALYLPILLRGYSQTGFVRQPSPEPLKSLQTPLKASFHPLTPLPERAPN